MVIGSVMLEMQRTGPTAKLVLKATPFSHETPITCDELEAFIRELSDAAMIWRRERNTIMVDYYRILGCARTATADEIQSAYRTLAKRQHPDVEGNTSAMQQLNAAVAVLSDPEQRRMYDATIS